MSAALFDTSLLGRPWAALLIAGAYLLGAVPFGLILAQLIKGVDLRQIGSGNIGATNAIRAMGRGWGYLVFALDFLKGCAPVLLAVWLAGPGADGLPMLQVLAGTAATLGHCYSLYLRFAGGKGVATGAGALVAIDPWLLLIGGAVWLLTRLTSGYAGLASILMGLAFPVAAWWRDESREVIVGAALLALLIIVRHRSNIGRMLRGTEPNARRKGARRGGAQVGETEEARHHG